MSISHERFEIRVFTPDGWRMIEKTDRLRDAFDRFDHRVRTSKDKVRLIDVGWCGTYDTIVKERT